MRTNYKPRKRLKCCGNCGWRCREDYRGRYGCTQNPKRYRIAEVTGYCNYWERR